MKPAARTTPSPRVLATDAAVSQRHRVARGLHVVPPRRTKHRGGFVRRHRVLVATIVVSLVVHLALIASGRWQAPNPDDFRSLVALTAQLAASAPAEAPRAAPEPVSQPNPAPGALAEPVPSPPATPVRVPPSKSLLPLAPVPTPAAPPRNTSAWIDVTMTAENESAAVDAVFAETLRREFPRARRVPIEFDVAPVVKLAPEVMKDAPQRMLRALVHVQPHGEVHLVQTHEYDEPYMQAISAALRGARAHVAADTEPRWGILVFWFQRVGEPATK